MLTAVLKAVKMLLSCCPKNNQDAVVLATLKAVQDAEKNHPTKTKYKDLFPSYLPDYKEEIHQLLCIRLKLPHKAALQDYS
jgi:hypothetical protein